MNNSIINSIITDNLEKLSFAKKAKEFRYFNICPKCNRDRDYAEIIWHDRKEALTGENNQGTPIFSPIPEHLELECRCGFRWAELPQCKNEEIYK